MHRLSKRIRTLEEKAGETSPREKEEMVFVFGCFMDWDAGLRSKTPGLTNEGIEKAGSSGGLSHPDIRRLIEVVYLHKKELGRIDDPTLEAFIKRELATIHATWNF